MKVAPQTFKNNNLVLVFLKYFHQKKGEEGVQELIEEMVKLARSFKDHKEKDLPIRREVKEHQISLVSLDKSEIIKQMALIDYQLLKRIEPKEFLNQGWSKNAHLNSPNIVYFTEWFNSQSSWISSQILSQQTPEERAHILDYVIELGYVQFKFFYFYLFYFIIIFLFLFFYFIFFF